MIFGTYNIWSRRNRSLESALHWLAQVQVDCGVLKETKFTDRVYTRESSGFWVTETATAAPSAHCVGVAVFCRKSDYFAIEELRLHGPNVVSFQLVIWRRRWHAAGCYIFPSDTSAIEDVVAAIRD